MNNLMPYYIRGRFEFLHRYNVACILHAEKLNPNQPLLLLEKSDDTFYIRDDNLRMQFLRGFNFNVRLEIGDPQDFLSYRPLPHPQTQEMEALISEFRLQANNVSVFHDPDRLKRLLSHKSQKTLVMTNGCFDILHPGHLKTLQAAKKLGDRLLVAINSDKSIKQFKGAERPIHSELFRAALLTQLCAVDFVFIFSEDTILNTLKTFQPDFHIKGGSFIPDRIAAERDLLASWGGQLITLPMVENYSTTNLLTRYPSGKFPI